MQRPPSIPIPTWFVWARPFYPGQPTEASISVSTLALPEFPVPVLHHSPLFIVVSGPSGVGKDVTLRRMKEMGAPFHFLVTNTTRPRREAEQEGIDYHFISIDEFQAKLARGEFLENANVYGHLYGNSRSEIEGALGRG